MLPGDRLVHHLLVPVHKLALVADLAQFIEISHVQHLLRLLFLFFDPFLFFHDPIGLLVALHQLRELLLLLVLLILYLDLSQPLAVVTSGLLYVVELLDIPH